MAGGVVPPETVSPFDVPTAPPKVAAWSKGICIRSRQQLAFAEGLSIFVVRFTHQLERGVSVAQAPGFPELQVEVVAVIDGAEVPAAADVKARATRREVKIVFGIPAVQEVDDVAIALS